MATTWLKRDGRRRETKVWRDWLDLVPRIRAEFANAIDDDPMLYNETASVSILASAASRAGLLALSEYSATKRGTGRGRPHLLGRCDLWVAEPSGRTMWSFELKQMFCLPKARGGKIKVALERACEDARAVHPMEADHRFGGLLLSGVAGCTLSDRALELTIALAKDCTFAVRFDGGTNLVWLLLRQVT